MSSSISSTEPSVGRAYPSSTINRLAVFSSLFLDKDTSCIPSSYFEMYRHSGVVCSSSSCVSKTGDSESYFLQYSNVQAQPSRNHNPLLCFSALFRFMHYVLYLNSYKKAYNGIDCTKSCLPACVCFNVDVYILN